MWPFKKKEVEVEVEQEDFSPRIYSSATIKLDDGEVLEFKFWKVTTSPSYHNFQTDDGWREIKINNIRHIRVKYLHEAKVIPIRPETNQCAN